MQRFLGLLLMGLAFYAFSSTAGAADEKVQLKGTVVCGKCELGESDKCAVVIVVDKGGKKTNYWFDTTSSKKYHGDVCQETKPGTVTGTVKKDGDKMVVTVTDLKFAK